MGGNSTESGEDSDLLASAQPISSNKTNAAENIKEDFEDGGNKCAAKIYSCLYKGCNASFNNLNTFTSHKFGHTGSRSSANQQSSDEVPDKEPSISKDHNKSLVNTMKRLLNQDSEDINQWEKRHKCTYPGCSAAFVRPNKLQAHLCTHTNERPYICSAEGCVKSYTNPSHLKRHVQSVHSTKPVDIYYNCTFEGCKLALKSSQALKKHYKRKHEGLDYQCTECDSKFKKHKQLALHILQHKGTSTFNCQKCEKIFVTEHQLKRHEQRGHKVYKCSVPNCLEGPFSLWTLYRKHMALKHRPDFICDVCQQSFPFMFRLRMHKELHHSASVANPFCCSYPGCTLTFKEKRYLSQHTRHVHEGVCFECPREGCGKKFHWKVSFDRHIKLHESSRARPRPRKKTKKRKDSGVPKKSVATKITDIIVPVEIEKQLLTKEAVDSEEDILISESGKIIISEKQCTDTTSETEAESSSRITESDDGSQFVKS